MVSLEIVLILAGVMKGGSTRAATFFSRWDTARDDSSATTTPKHRSPTQELQRLLNLYNHHNPSCVIFCHTLLHEQQPSFDLDFSVLCFIAAFGRDLLFPSVAREPGWKRASDDSSLLTDTIGQYPLCYWAVESCQSKDESYWRNKGNEACRC